jgi:tripartite-type tricarboxylate transporter receptor subunit TctC
MKVRPAGVGVEPLPSTPQQLASRLKDDMARWETLVKASDARLN